MCCAVCRHEIFKKFTSSNFLAKEFYTQKTRKSRLFMSARTSCTTFAHPSICSSPVLPDLFQMLQLIHLSNLIHPIHPTRLIHPSRFEKNFRCVKTYKIYCLLIFAEISAICCHLLSFSVCFCANFR